MDFPDFAVACGEEGSDPVVLHEGNLFRVDQFRMSNHLAHQDEDLAEVADLGVRLWRYGMPWRLTEASPGVYDWTLWDRAMAACERHGLTPVVDLLHFGLPDHLNGFADETWVAAFRDYVGHFVDRYAGPTFFTPVNEPGITAMFSARYGMWNDRLASSEDYFRVLANVVLANLEALAVIRSDRDAWWIGSEGFGCGLVSPRDPVGLEDATTARDMEWLVWDLHLGIEPRGEALAALDAIPGDVLGRIDRLVGVVPHERIIAGHDIYPVSVTAYGSRSAEPVTISDRVAAYLASARDWYDRYRLPFWVSETSNLGLDVADGAEWLAALVGGLDRMRMDGRPVRGLCWYSRGDQYDWDSALLTPVGKVTEVGLFDAQRRPRPVAGHFARLAQQWSPHRSL